MRRWCTISLWPLLWMVGGGLNGTCNVQAAAVPSLHYQATLVHFTEAVQHHRPLFPSPALLPTAHHLDILTILQDAIIKSSPGREAARLYLEEILAQPSTVRLLARVHFSALFRMSDWPMDELRAHRNHHLAPAAVCIIWRRIILQDRRERCHKCYPKGTRQAHLWPCPHFIARLHDWEWALLVRNLVRCHALMPEWALVMRALDAVRPIPQSVIHYCGLGVLGRMVEGGIGQRHVMLASITRRIVMKREARLLGLIELHEAGCMRLDHQTFLEILQQIPGTEAIQARFGGQSTLPSPSTVYPALQSFLLNRSSRRHDDHLSVVYAGGDPWYFAEDGLMEVWRAGAKLASIRRTLHGISVSRACTIIINSWDVGQLRIEMCAGSSAVIECAPGDVILLFWGTHMDRLSVAFRTLPSILESVGPAGHSLQSLNALRRFLKRTERSLDCILYIGIQPDND